MSRVDAKHYFGSKRWELDEMRKHLLGILGEQGRQGVALDKMEAALGRIAGALAAIEGHLAVMSFAMGSETALSLPDDKAPKEEPEGGASDLSDLDGGSA